MNQNMPTGISPNMNSAMNLPMTNGMNPNNFSIPSQSTAPPYQDFISPIGNNANQTITGDAPYAENLLELNVGKFATFYMSYSDSLEWRDKIFSGIIEAAGRDYALLFDQTTGRRYLLWTLYLNYVEFKEPIIYEQKQG